MPNANDCQSALGGSGAGATYARAAARARLDRADRCRYGDSPEPGVAALARALPPHLAERACAACICKQGTTEEGGAARGASSAHGGDPRGASYVGCDARGRAGPGAPLTLGSGDQARRALVLFGFARGVWCPDARLLEDAPPLFGQRGAALRMEAADFHVGACADRLPATASWNCVTAGLRRARAGLGAVAASFAGAGRSPTKRRSSAKGSSMGVRDYMAAGPRRSIATEAAFCASSPYSSSARRSSASE